MRGLCPDVAYKLPTRMYDSYYKVTKAAEAAQWMRNSMNNGTIHTIKDATAEDEGDDEEEVHALNFKKGFTKRRFSKKNQKKDWRKKKPFQEEKKFGKPGTILCFKCRQPGHFIRNCPYTGNTPSSREGSQHREPAKGKFRPWFKEPKKKQ